MQHLVFENLTHCPCEGYSIARGHQNSANAVLNDLC
ncbi:hypothetical protein CBM2587_A170050 [Cupriavidus taiwanensis]|uniref:Uncharacterized protein n=1 Tax=Cupriavidus taiwanensis TaxID=164546 RepID=A0A975WY35_9BURK|nr:hypothetical protein CBM2587_A170050 [Cupriavidus taiwanensis]